MFRIAPLVVSWSVLLGAAADVSAQLPVSEQFRATEPAALTPEQDAELDRWLSDMEKWQRYDARWRNRPVRSDWGRIVERKPHPKPPDWLPSHCASAGDAISLEPEGRTAKVCRLLADPQAAIGAVPPPQQAARAAAEKPKKHSSFLTRVHVDGLWSTVGTDGRAYGIVGSHVTLVDVGRLQVFGPPGVLLVSLPDVNGSRRITLGYTWGVSVRLADVRLFTPTKNMTLFLNVSKVWVSGGPEGSRRALDIAGFSIAPRRKS